MFVRPPEYLKRIAKRCPRRTGVILTLMGAILFFAFLVFPLFQARNHAQQIWISRDATIVAIITLSLGGLQIVLGNHLAKLIEPTAGGSRVAALVVVLIAFQGGFVAHRALKGDLERRGYRSPGPMWQFEIYQYPAACPSFRDSLAPT